MTKIHNIDESSDGKILVRYPRIFYGYKKIKNKIEI